MKVAFIAGPYRAKSVRGMILNIRQAEKYALRYWKKGYAVICPHLNTSLLDGNDTDHMFLDGAIEIMKRCDLVVMIPGWSTSVGARNEYEVAKSLGITILIDTIKV